MPLGEIDGRMGWKDSFNGKTIMNMGQYAKLVDSDNFYIILWTSHTDYKQMTIDKRDIDDIVESLLKIKNR